MKEKKTPITEEPWFYKRTGTEHSGMCHSCIEHEFVVVQKFGPYYTMHSFVSRSAQVKFIHRWQTRAEDPVCLLDFEPVKVVPGWGPKLDPAQFKNELDKAWGGKSFVEFIDSMAGAPNFPSTQQVIYSADSNVTINVNPNWNLVDDSVYDEWQEFNTAVTGIDPLEE